MNAKSRFGLIYAPQVKIHLQAIELKYHSLIRRTIDTQLQFEPNLETQNRKPLKRPLELGADWEIRFGPDNRFRVFYSVELKNRPVFILAIGIKRGDRLIIGREGINL